MKSNGCSGVVWHDRKRFCGFPLSFVHYQISDDRLFFSAGFLNWKHQEIQLYLIQDLSVTQTLSQRFCGVGTVVVTTVDERVIELVNIRSPYAVKELLYGFMEQEKRKKWYRRADYVVRRPEWFT